MHAEVFLQGLIAFLIVAFGQPSFAPWLGPIAACLGYALFWRAIRIYPFIKQRFWRGSLWYTAVSLIQLSWMSSIGYQGIYILFVWLGLSIWLGLQFGFLTLFIPYNKPLTIPRILAIASLWTLMEWSRFHLLCGYSWNLSGLALSDIYSLQLSAVFGILGLSFWVIFVNLLGLRALLKKRIFSYCTWGIAAATPCLFGLFHLSYHEKKMAKQKESFSCLLIQTGLLPSEKIPLEGKVREFISPYEQWRRILSFASEHKEKKLDLIILPEAAVPFSSKNAIYHRKQVEKIFFNVFGNFSSENFPKNFEEKEKVSNLFWAQTLSNIMDTEIIIGLDHIEETGHSYNSAFHIKSFSNSVARYDKRVLMPLAEYLPFSFLAPLVRIYGLTDFFTPGISAKIFEGKKNLSVSICYEETFPEKLREGRLNGGKIFVNVTNDGWYPFSRLPSQHYEHAKFRAVENGVPLFRACNTGVSAVVDSLGRSKGKIEQNIREKNLQSGALFAKVSTYEYPTLFTFWGNKGILCASFIFLGGFLFLKKKLYW